jgi:hypothetical protein
MRFSWSKRRSFAVGALLIILTNAVALGSVAYNRSGQPTSMLVLTERELGIAHRDKWLDEDNSSIDLALRWRVPPKQDQSDPSPYYAWGTELHWLDEDAKRQLGYPMPAQAVLEQASRGWEPLERDAFVVLEYDGDAYRLALDLARKNFERARALAQANPEKEIQERLLAAQEQMSREESQESRLFVVDVGVEPDALRARYSDRSRYAVVRARLDAYLSGPLHDRRVVVRVVALDVETVSVPHAFRKDVERFLPDVPTYSYPYERRAPRFEAAVNWGRRFEPWIVAFRPLEPNADA